MTAPTLARPCPFVAFIGARGGVGVSMAVINVAGLLAARGFDVLVIDLDREAPALSRWARRRGGAGAVRVRETLPIAMPEVTDDGRGGSLSILNLERTGDGLGDDVGDEDPLDLGALRRSIAGSPRFDVVLVDGGRGRGPAIPELLDLADPVVLLSALTPASVESGARLLAALRSASAPATTPPLVILSPIPSAEDDLIDARTRAAADAFAAAWGAPVATDLQIPYHPRLALSDEPMIFRRRHGPLIAAYLRIEARILEEIGDAIEPLTARAIAAAKADAPALALALLRRARLVADADAPWIDAFTRALAEVDPPASGEGAAALYDLAIAHASPGARRHFARVIGRRAVARWRRDGLFDEAQALFERALAADPNHSNTLGHYATFLCDERRDLDAAEAMYQRAIDADPSDAQNLGSYATFLCDERRAIDAAEAMYRRALDADPDEANNLGNYATLLFDERGAIDDAAALYARALAADPDHANTVGNFARLCLSAGRVDEGIALVDRALALTDDDAPQELDAECTMYLYCCGPAERRGPALARLRALITVDGIRTGAWDFAAILAQGARMAHPEARWLAPLAEVLAGRQPPPTLAAWDAWAGAAAVLPV